MSYKSLKRFKNHKYFNRASYPPLGVSILTLRRSEKEGVFSPSYRSCRSHRRFTLVTLEALFQDKTKAPDTSSRLVTSARE